VLLAGMAMFAGFSLFPAKKLAPQSLERAAWATVQIAGGLLMILAAQFLALVRLAPEDEKLNFRDALLPFRLWGLVFRRLPALRLSVWLAGWGISLILSAVILIGGLSYWMKFLPQAKNRPGPTSAAVGR
jgi:hypothetical protein